MNRRPRRRANGTPSLKVLIQRMREIWIDGFGLMPYTSGIQADHIRRALIDLVDDDDYWIDLKQLIDQKEKVAALVKQLKTPPGRALKTTTKPRKRAEAKP